MAQLEVLALDITVPRGDVPQGADTYLMPDDVEIQGDLAINGLVDGRDVALDGTNQDNHIADVTTNPHSVTAAQAGAVDSTPFAGATTLMPALTIVARSRFDNSTNPAWIDQQSDKAWEVVLGSMPMFGEATAIAASVTIWDATTGVPVSWGVSPTSLGVITSVAFEGHTLVVGSSTGVWVYDFNAGHWANYTTSGLVTYSLSPFTALGTAGAAVAAIAIVNNTVNAVAITYLPNAPIVNGVQVPTILVTTDSADGAASVITHDKEVFDITFTGTGLGSSGATFLSDGKLGFAHDFAGFSRIFRVYDIPTADIAEADWGFTLGNAAYFFSNAGIVTYTGQALPNLAGHKHNAMTANGFVSGDTDGLSVVLPNVSNSAASMGAKITNTYNTGHMVGDIQAAFCADAAASITDRSVKALASTSTTIVTAAVATGAELRSFVDTGGNITATLGATIANGHHTWLEQTAGVWHHYVSVVDGAGASTAVGYIDGVASTAVPIVNNVVAGGTGVTILTNIVTANARYSATAITAEQAALSARDELALCQVNALCLASGNSAAVTDLEYFPDQDIYAFNSGTDKRDYFKGLKRVDSLTLATGVTDSGNELPVNDLHSSGTVNYYKSRSRDINSEIKALNMSLAEKGQSMHFPYTTSGTTQALPQGWKPEGRQIGDSWVIPDSLFTTLDTVTLTFDGFIYTLTGHTTAKVFDIELGVA